MRLRRPRRMTEACLAAAYSTVRPSKLSTEDPGHILHEFGDHFDPFFRRKKLILDRAAPDRNDQLIKDFDRAFDHIEMAVGHRVE